MELNGIGGEAGCKDGAPSSLKSVHKAPLVFALNGKRVELSSVDPATTLLSFIRSETRFKGPKRGCGEGMFFQIDHVLCLLKR